MRNKLGLTFLINPTSQKQHIQVIGKYSASALENSIYSRDIFSN